MRYAALALLALFLLAPAFTFAQFYNDSNVINLGPGFLPDDPGNGGSGTDEEDDGLEGQGGSSGGDGEGDSEAEDVPGTETTFGAVIVTTDGSSNDDASSGTDSANSVSAQSLVDTLSANLAISGSGSAGASGFGGGVDGARARAALLARGITGVYLPDTGPAAGGTWSGGKKRIPLSRDDVALVISSTSLTDENLVAATFTQDSLDITYRASGRLLFFIPKGFTVRVALNFKAESVEERVTVKFPWYKFLLKTGVSKKALVQELDAAVLANRGAPEGFDAAAAVFTATADVLRARHGVVTFL
jgi:hypothetical protein